MRDPVNAPTTSGAASYRCFLFADLRGYTSFLERAGNTAGVELLADYLAIMRTCVGEHHGAEIKVEGDGFHAVFPSASSAVMCGLAVVEAARRKNDEGGDRPLRIGIGIHAGEAVETGDGFIGSAVNIAARVCAAAESGEVLVTGTVRDITQASIPVRFERRGRRQLKGIADRVEVFRAVPEGTAVAGRTWPARSELLLGFGALAILALAAVVIALGLGARAPAAAASPSPDSSPASSTAATLPLAVGPLAIGHYATSGFEPGFTFDIGDPGWALYRDLGSAFGLYHEVEPKGRLDAMRVEEIYADPCGGGTGMVSGGRNATELANALQQIDYLEVRTVSARNVAGQSGLVIDFEVEDGAQAACGGLAGAGIPLIPLGDESWNVDVGEHVRVYAVDVAGGTVSLVVTLEAFAASSVAAEEEFYLLAESVIDSASFGE